MGFLLLSVAGIAGIVSLVCFIMVLIKLFQEKGIVHGILGILCSLYTFIWGWMHADRLGVRNIMMIWSICLVISIIFNVAGQAMMPAQ
jgi:hypothetical protein